MALLRASLVSVVLSVLSAGIPTIGLVTTFPNSVAAQSRSDLSANLLMDVSTTRRALERVQSTPEFMRAFAARNDRMMRDLLVRAGAPERRSLRFDTSGVGTTAQPSGLTVVIIIECNEDGSDCTIIIRWRR